MKKTIIIGLICGMAVAVAGMLKEDRVVIEEVTITHENSEKNLIPVKVTLTKYQLQKMLSIIEEKHSDFSVHPAAPQDSMTFKASARGVKGVYEISSTQLARYTGKIRRELEE